MESDRALVSAVSEIGPTPPDPVARDLQSTFSGRQHSLYRLFSTFLKYPIVLARLSRCFADLTTLIVVYQRCCIRDG